MFFIGFVLIINTFLLFAITCILAALETKINNNYEEDKDAKEN